jgi:hypothetical protein
MAEKKNSPSKKETVSKRLLHTRECWRRASRKYYLKKKSLRDKNPKEKKPTTKRKPKK